MLAKFSLQSILDYRHSRVEGLEVELGQLLQAQQQAQSVLEALQFRHGHLIERLGKVQTGEIDLSQIAQLRTNIQMVEHQIVRQHNLINALVEKISAKRAEMIRAKQDEESLNTLKRKENDRFQVQLAQLENRQQDDAYISQGWRAAQSLISYF